MVGVAAAVGGVLGVAGVVFEVAGVDISGVGRM